MPVVLGRRRAGARHVAHAVLHVGAGAGVAAELSEGVLYYGGQGAAGLNVRDYVTEINSRNDLGNFIESCAAPTGPLPGFDAGLDVPCDKQLAIVDIGVDKDAPHGCLHIFSAVLSLGSRLLAAAAS